MDGQPKEIDAFDCWGIVEIMGHKVFAGRLTNASIGGGSFLRIDVPEVEGLPAFTKFFGGASIFSISPTDETTARRAAAQYRERPVQIYEAPAPRAITQRSALDDANEFADERDY